VYFGVRPHPTSTQQTQPAEARFEGAENRNFWITSGKYARHNATSNADSRNADNKPDLMLGRVQSHRLGCRSLALLRQRKFH
jgi:hypothetical protein